MKTLFFSALLFLSGGLLPAATGTLAAVFAHPDDDITIGPLLAHYAKRGIKVHLIVATSGDKGATAHANIPPGKKLAAIREEEMKAACKAYGIAEPIFLREGDGTLHDPKKRERILEKLRKEIAALEPEVIVTFGADGVTAHADHRAIGSLTTEVFQNWNGPGKPPQKLYYVAFPESLFKVPVPPFGKPGTVEDAFITTVIDCRDSLKEAEAASYCFKSQHTPEVSRAIAEMFSNTFQGKIYLRRALSRLPEDEPLETSLFAE